MKILQKKATGFSLQLKPMKCLTFTIHEFYKASVYVEGCVEDE